MPKKGRYWRPRPESNRGARICSPLRSHSATRPLITTAGSAAGRGPRLSKGKGQGQGECPSEAKNNALNVIKSPEPCFLRFAIRACLAICRFVAARQWSPIAQLVEHSTVNRMVAGSSPARGATLFQTVFYDGTAHLSRFCVLAGLCCLRARRQWCDCTRLALFLDRLQRRAEAPNDTFGLKHIIDIAA